MDIFSHTLLPYLLGNYFEKRKEVITALVMGGIAPDFDYLILWIQNVYPTFFLITHRGITHSLVFGFLIGILILFLASLNTIKNRVNKYINFEPVFSRQNILYAMTGVLIHLFLDYLTTTGIPLFYPFDATRYSAELLFYKDIHFGIVSLIIIIFVVRKPFKNQTNAKLLIIFLLLLGGWGVLRYAEKNNAEDYFHDRNIQIFPSMHPFNWYALKEDVDKITIFNYNGLERKSTYEEIAPRFNIISTGDGFDKALGIADQTPQVKMFRWRAHAVAVNASYGNGTWSLEYYDPVKRMEMRDYSSTFGIEGPKISSININVTGEIAIVLLQSI